MNGPTSLICFLLFLWGIALAHAGPEQAPRPPQAPPIPKPEFDCDCGEKGCHRYTDGQCHCADCPLHPTKVKAACPCSPACTCGCNAGQACSCGAPTPIPTQQYQVPPAYFAPAPYYQGAPSRPFVGGGGNCRGGG